MQEKGLIYIEAYVHVIPKASYAIDNSGALYPITLAFNLHRFALVSEGLFTVAYCKSTNPTERLKAEK